MPLEAKKNLLVATGLVGVEDAEILLEWLLKHPRGRLDFADCTHLHAANVQVLMAARPKIAVWPHQEALADWLRAALTEEGGAHVQDDSGGR